MGKTASSIESRKGVSPEKDFKVAIIVLYSVVIPLIIVVFLIFVFRIWFFGFTLSMMSGGPKAEENNPAKQLASIMVPFAEQHHWNDVYEINSPVVFDNRTPWFEYVYEGTVSLAAVHEELKQYLEEKGYIITETLRNSDPNKGKAGNADQPWWEMDGRNAGSDTVHVEITDKTFYNGATIPSIGKDDSDGIYQIPQGRVFINLSFRTNVNAR